MSALLKANQPPLPPLADETNAVLENMRQHYRQNETELLKSLYEQIAVSDESKKQIHAKAASFVKAVRDNRKTFGGLDSFLQEFGLSTQEGIALMCLAEALLRIPDNETRDLLIKDKIGSANWDQHIGKGGDLFVNASTWALMLTGKVIGELPVDGKDDQNFISKLISKAGEPVVRTAMLQAMKILGKQFVMGRTIDEALARAREFEKDGYQFSYDILGESARTFADAERYFNAYALAIDAIGENVKQRAEVQHSPHLSPGISIKLSALHPRYEFINRDEAIKDLSAKLLKLAQKCAHYNIKLTVDAEEAHRLEMSLEIIANVFRDESLGQWQGFGLAIQAYLRRAHHVVDYIVSLCREMKRPMMVRLVKGAYWDSEIKNAQMNGVSDYPVFTRKAATDISYLACAKKLLGARDALYPMFATHNAHTVASIIGMAGNDQKGFEFQRLHGMGETLYQQIVGQAIDQYTVRIYAPVGSHEDLLPYLVRRLLENGANSSFVNRLQNDAVPIEQIIADPRDDIAKRAFSSHPKIPLPRDLFGQARKNSYGFEFADRFESTPILKKIADFLKQNYSAYPLINGQKINGLGMPVTSPQNRDDVVGTVEMSDKDHMVKALEVTSEAFYEWSRTPALARAEILRKCADALEEHMAELIALCIREAGKTIADGIAEVREAVDFCRYYADECEKHFATPTLLPGYTGEDNFLSLHGKGVFLCISPWNFPLAIFLGQITAALAAGNTVIAKPAEQTPLIAMRAVELLLKAGLPKNVLAFLPADGRLAGTYLTPDTRIAGIAFTGSTEVAQIINRTLAAREGAIATLIAETGGLNAMIVDSSALAEQVVEDVMTSAFKSAGQRCSALRLLMLHETIADKVITMLKGASALLNIADPRHLTTDVGPVIDDDALALLRQHYNEMLKIQTHLFTLEISENVAKSHSFFAPCAFELKSINDLEREVFGPILHIVRYRDDTLDEQLKSLMQKGYGLTLGVHSRIEHTINRIFQITSVGNTYINRSIIGAVVGVQPFGGQGLSGTGPKAGGPHYLMRFATEKVLTINTTASGGNTTLVSLADEI